MQEICRDVQGENLGIVGMFVLCIIILSAKRDLLKLRLLFI